MNDATKLHEARTVVPADREGFDNWIDLRDALSFIRADLALADLVLYSSVGDVFMHAVLVPNASLNPPDFEDLMGWNFNPYHSGWGLSYGFNPARVTVEPPLHGCGSASMTRGEQLLFMRTFDGYDEKGTYVEILQKLLHVFSLHFIEERNAYCRLDDRGDLEDVIAIHRVEGAGSRGGLVVTIKRDLLDEYAAVTDTSVVRMFDLTRTRPKSFSGWSDQAVEGERTDGDVHYRYHIEPGCASYMRGVQVIPSRMSRDEAADNWRPGDPGDRQYESFVAVDRKNGDAVCEISTHPSGTSNYFTESTLPWEVSPAFFRPEVLLRYKADTNKYSLHARSISCRGAWSLTTFDINDAGQIHTYIVYLRDLPHEEQLHWKAHNEAPKGPMSERAITTDLHGQRYSTRDALEGIQATVRALNDQKPSWWVPRSEKTIEKVFYVVTTSEDEWGTELLNLDQLTTEGFIANVLRSHASRLGRNGIEHVASLKLIENCLIGLGWDEQPALEATAPLHTLRKLRSLVKAHDGGSGAAAIRKGVLREHRTFANHFRTLCQDIDRSLMTIARGLAPLR